MTLIAIGGAEDRIGDMPVLKRVLEESHRLKPHVLVITTATSYPQDVANTYQNAFSTLGVTCDIAHITDSNKADASDFMKLANTADVIFFSGGDQTKLATVFNDTNFLKLISNHSHSQKVIAGTSAGAAIMSKLMITGGRPENAFIKGEIRSATGFGLADNIIFDTHFLNRNRLPRLFNLVASDPTKTGIGLDENTGIILKNDQSIEVIGNQNVTIVDGTNLHKNTLKHVRNGQKFTVDGFKVTTLKRGQKYLMPKTP